MTKTKKRKLSQEMTEERMIAIAKQKIANLGLDPEDIMPKLQAKMGQYACKFVDEAVYPGYVCNRTGETFKKTKALISAYANEDISEERLARALGAKTKKEAIAQTVKIQEAAAKYLTKKDLMALTDANIFNIQQEAAQKQAQTESRITTRAPEAVLEPVQKEAPKEAVLDPVMTEPVTAAPKKFPFTFEPVNTEIAPWLKSNPISEPKSVEATPEQEAEGNGTPLDPLRDKAREELARLKAGKTGELTLEELINAGVSKKDDMPKVITKNNFGEIHAGPTAKEKAKRIKERAGNQSGNCMTADRNAEADSVKVTGIAKPYEADYRNYTNKRNAAVADDAWEKMQHRIMVRFDSDKKNGNPEILTCDIGTSVNFDGAPKKTYLKDKKGRIVHRKGKPVLLTQPDGHVSTKGTDGRWYSDHDDNKNNPNWLQGTSAAKRYGSTYNVSWYTDCTASDKLAEEMLYQKLLREERDRKENTKESAQTEQNDQPVNIAMINAAQNTL